VLEWVREEEKEGSAKHKEKDTSKKVCCGADKKEKK
jgi:hypothetical protein